MEKLYLQFIKPMATFIPYISPLNLKENISNGSSRGIKFTKILKGLSHQILWDLFLACMDRSG